MKKQERTLRSCLIALYMLFSIQGIQAVVTWDGAGNPPVTVTDEDLILDGCCGRIRLPVGTTSINASTVDVNVTLASFDVEVESDAGQAILYLNPAVGRTITFDLTGLYDLTFLGSLDGTTRLLIVHDGGGDVDFVMAGGRRLTLTNDLTHGPVEFYLVLKTVDEYTPKPLLSFIREDATLLKSNSQIEIVIGEGSLLSYASRDGLINESTGCIEFSPINNGTGRMALRVFQAGAFTMAVHAVEEEDGNLIGVLRNTPAGGIATTHIIKDTTVFDEYEHADACLVITNYNNAYAEYLIDPYGNLGAATDLVDYSGAFNGLRYGVSAGANHILFVDDGACLDYVGLANNTCPSISSLPGIIDPERPTELCPCDGGIEKYLKLRNYSALTIDGWWNPNSLPSAIKLGVQSGIYFRSGIDANGNIVSTDLSNPHVFTLNPELLLTAGAGEYVFDVEAELQVTGSNVNTTEVLNSRFEILSLEVAPNTGPLFPVEGTGTNFNARTFARDMNDNLYRYNKAAWLINDRAIFTDTAIAHTDENHRVCENNDVVSEPTYVGGEKWWLSVLREENPLVPRPLIGFEDGLFQIQTSVALTGVDLLAPTFVEDGSVFANESVFRFYSNGYLVDNGTGRAMILGTLIGSQACDGCTIISDDAHLDVYQDSDYVNTAELPVQILFLTVSDNNSAVNEDITTDIDGQTSIHSLYLGHNSNISIGVNADTTGFTNDTELSLLIAGNFFHFGTRGGSLGIPSTSSVTGQGGIFVDLNGIFAILPNFIASIDAMVTKSHNGIVDLPANQVFFSDQVGITDWQQDLAVNPVIVPTNAEYSDYTLNWLTVTKDPNFVPYLVDSVNICSCPEVTPDNILNIPTVFGEVDQLQVVNSRIGDPVHILISGNGWVRELLWLSDCRAAEAPVAVVVLQEHGRIGLNNAHRNPDSVFTQTTLGVNGINIVANGNGRVDLNDDMIVNNVCAFLQGPDFKEDNVLDIQSDVPYTLRVTKDGVLDFSHFTVAGKIRFGENIRVNLEPGATIVLGAATVEFGDSSVVEVESSYELPLIIEELDKFAGAIDNTVNPLVSVDYTQPNNQYSPLTNYGNDLNNTDQYRVRILGTGTLRFTDNASLTLRTNGILSVETIDVGGCSVPSTAVTIELNEAAQFNIGNGNNILGGSFQVGDVTPFEGRTIDFTLLINGADATFGMGSGAFLGLGAGVVRPAQGGAQSNVIADTLFNVRTVKLDLKGGNFKADRVFNSDDERSQSIVFGSMANFQVDYINVDTIAELDAADFLVSGGGNLFYLLPGGETDLGGIRLINRQDDDIIDAPWPSLAQPNRTVALRRLRDGILASSELLDMSVDLDEPAETIFLALKVSDATNELGRSTGIAVAAPVNPDRFRNARTLGRFGYIDRGFIGRQDFADLINTNGASEDDRRQDAYDIGAARVQVDTSVPAPGPVTVASSILN